MIGTWRNQSEDCTAGFFRKWILFLVNANNESIFILVLVGELDHFVDGLGHWHAPDFALDPELLHQFLLLLNAGHDGGMTLRHLQRALNTSQWELHGHH